MFKKKGKGTYYRIYVLCSLCFFHIGKPGILCDWVFMLELGWQFQRNHITELHCLGTECFLVDNTVQFNSAVVNHPAHQRNHPILLACHCWSPIHCNFTQLDAVQFHVIDHSGYSFKNVLTFRGAL